MRGVFFKKKWRKTDARKRWMSSDGKRSNDPLGQLKKKYFVMSNCKDWWTIFSGLIDPVQSDGFF